MVKQVILWTALTIAFLGSLLSSKDGEATELPVFVVSDSCQDRNGFNVFDTALECVPPTGKGPFIHWNLQNTPDGKIPYYISSKGSKNLTLTDVKKAVEESFETWKQIDGVNLDFKFIGYLDPCTAGKCNLSNQFKIGDTPDGKNVVFFDEAGVYFGPDGSIKRDALGSTRIRSWKSDTGEILEADIILNGTYISAGKKCKPIFNAAIIWNLKDQGCSYASQLNYRADTKSTLVHEIGHFLGLGHTATPGATMSTSGFDDNIEQRSLEEEDRRGVRFLYTKSYPSPGKISINGVKVNDFYKSAVAEYGPVLRLYFNDKWWVIDFNKASQVFTLGVYARTPIESAKNRVEIEKTFLEILGISHTEACKLKVERQTYPPPGFGEDDRLSFCKKASGSTFHKQKKQ